MAPGGGAGGGAGAMPVGPAYPKKVQIVRNRNGHCMGFHQRGRTYVVGFPSPMHLSRVCDAMSPKSRMFLANHLPDNTSHDIHYRVRKAGIAVAGGAGAPGGAAPIAGGGAGATRADREGQVNNVSVDITAHFYLERRRPPESLFRASSWIVDEMPFNDFIMLPFRKNLGIVLPMELMLEDRARFVFESHVVDPCYDPVLFQPSRLG